MQKADIKDLVSPYYQADVYLSPSEMDWVQKTFKDNPQAIKIIRKILMPTISDPELPLEEMNKDMFMARVDFTQVPDEHIKSIVMGLQNAAKIVMGGLIHLKVIANSTEEQREHTVAERRRKDSVK